MRLRTTLLISALALVPLMILGCGGGHNSVAGRGTVKLTIIWPTTRAIPADTQSIKLQVQVLQPDDGNVIREKIIARPAAQTRTTVTLDFLPSVKLRITALAMSGLEGTGNILAQGSKEINVPAFGSVSADIEIDKIDHVTIQPGSTTINVGGAAGLLAKAVDASGKEVTVDPSKWKWSVVPSSIATVPTGVASVIVTGLKAGTGVVFVQLEGTSFSASANLTVTDGGGGGGGGGGSIPNGSFEKLTHLWVFSNDPRPQQRGITFDITDSSGTTARLKGFQPSSDDPRLIPLFDIPITSTGGTSFSGTLLIPSGGRFFFQEFTMTVTGKVVNGSLEITWGGSAPGISVTGSPSPDTIPPLQQ